MVLVTRQRCYRNRVCESLDVPRGRQCRFLSFGFSQSQSCGLRPRLAHCLCKTNGRQDVGRLDWLRYRLVAFALDQLIVFVRKMAGSAGNIVVCRCCCGVLV